NECVLVVEPCLAHVPSLPSRRENLTFVTTGLKTATICRDPAGPSLDQASSPALISNVTPCQSLSGIVQDREAFKTSLTGRRRKFMLRARISGRQFRQNPFQLLS